jgi:hypothetical protein
MVTDNLDHTAIARPDHRDGGKEPGGEWPLRQRGQRFAKSARLTRTLVNGGHHHENPDRGGGLDADAEEP